MAGCAERLNGGPLVCTLPAGHPPGCVYVASETCKGDHDYDNGLED